MQKIDLYPQLPKIPRTEREIIQSRVRSYHKWARRRRILRIRSALFGWLQVRTPANCSCQPARSSSLILRNVTSGTVKA